MATLMTVPKRWQLQWWCQMKLCNLSWSWNNKNIIKRWWLWRRSYATWDALENGRSRLGWKDGDFVDGRQQRKAEKLSSALKNEQSCGELFWLMPWCSWKQQKPIRFKRWRLHWWEVAEKSWKATFCSERWVILWWALLVHKVFMHVYTNFRRHPIFNTAINFLYLEQLQKLPWKNTYKKYI